MSGLYLHIPFCVQKCAYCDFYSLPLACRVAGAAEAMVARFFHALEKELATLPPGFAPATVFMGGGTPTVLSVAQLGELLAMLRQHVRLEAVCEWTVEANPGTLTPEKTAVLRAAGVNRVSLGVQTLRDDALRRWGRIHSAAEAHASFELLRAAGFDNLGVDLMYALPGETTAQVLQDVCGMLAWHPEHMSCYALSFEPGTPLAEQAQRGQVTEVPDEEQAEQYHAVRQAMLAAGFQHYEISNFARPGRACRHNLNYWRGGDYVGCGPAAHGHLAGRRSANVENLDEYCRRIEAGGSACDFEERLLPEAKARETLVVGLRLLDGVDLAEFQQQTGFDARVLVGAALERLTDLGLLHLQEGRLRLAERSLFISNRVLAELI